MHYFRKVTDLETGEVRRISIGEHLTVTEAAQRFGVARSSLVKVLLRLNIFQKEFDAVAGEHRYRLRPEAQTKGMGYRIMGKHGPFDVLAPTTLDWIEEDLKALLSASTADTKTIAALQALDTFDQGRTHKLDLEGKVRWVAAGYRHRSQADCRGHGNVFRPADGHHGQPGSCREVLQAGDRHPRSRQADGGRVHPCHCHRGRQGHGGWFLR